MSNRRSCVMLFFMLQKRFKKLKIKTLLLFTEQMGVMLEAGVPILIALDNLRVHSKDPNFQGFLTYLSEELTKGGTLSQILRSQPELFSNYYCSLIEVGEHSGTLSSSFLSLSRSIARREQLRQAVKKAMIHPLSVLLVACAVTYFILIGLVPTFEELFASSGAALPKPTQLVIKFARSLQSKAFLGILLLLFSGFLFLRRRFLRNTSFRLKVERIFLYIPVIGPFLKRIHSAHYAEVLSIMLGAGVSVAKALEVLAESFTNEHYRRETLRHKESLEEGNTLALTFKDSHLFPPLMVTMIQVGEGSGRLPEMLARSAELQKEEVEASVDQLLLLLEPILIVFIGLLIGGIVVALYLPLFSLGEIF